MGVASLSHLILRQLFRGFLSSVATYALCRANLRKNNRKIFGVVVNRPIFASETTKTGSPVGEKARKQRKQKQ